VRTTVAASVGLLMLAAASGPARGDDVHCPPSLGNVTIDGNVLVAALCRLEGTIVIGNVHLYAGGSLIARDGVRIDGSIQGENADFIDLADTRVNGNIQLDNFVGDRSIVNRSSIGGSIQLKANRSRIEVVDNTIDADVQAFENRGLVLIAGNVVGGNLQCKENDPPPAGGNNVVEGSKEDQCASLQPENGSPGTGPVAPQAPAGQPASGSGGGGGSPGLLPLLLLSLVLIRRRTLAA
jgi:hypothetical protein